MIKGALLDFGGTIDTDGIHWLDMFRSAYQSVGLPVDGFRDSYVYTERTLGRNSIIVPGNTFLETLHIKVRLQLECMCVKTDESRLVDFCYSYVEDNIKHISAPVLDELSSHIPLVLVSNFYGNMHTVLHEFAIDGFFADVVESAVVGIRKPDPEIFRMGIKSLQVTPEECVAVGDSLEKDIFPASAAGCHTVWLSSEGCIADSGNRPDGNIRSLRDLPGLIVTTDSPQNMR